MMRQAIVLGGTGMLKGVTLGLLADRYQVAVIGRTQARLKGLQHEAGQSPFLTPLSLDYHDTDRLARWLAHTQLMQGPVDLVVAWVKEPSEPVFSVLSKEVSAYRNTPWRLVHVLGSSASRHHVAPALPDLCRYQTVILGFQRDRGQSRWLTHEEISLGVLEAVRSENPLSIVGIVEPWDFRPSS